MKKIFFVSLFLVGCGSTQVTLVDDPIDYDELIVPTAESVVINEELVSSVQDNTYFLETLDSNQRELIENYDSLTSEKKNEVLKMLKVIFE